VLRAADPRLPLDPAGSPRELTSFFNERVLPERYPGCRLRRARIRRVSRERGGRQLWLCALDAEEGQLPPYALVTRPDPPAAAAGSREAGGEALVEFFPSDRRLPGLAAATDLARLAPLLERAAPGARPGEWALRVLRYHPGVRCVLLYEDRAEPARRLVGKVYRKRKKAAKVWEVLERLAELPAPRGFRAPRPLLRLAEHNLLLMEHLAGRSFRDLAVAGGADEKQLANRAAAAFAALHALSADGLEPIDLGVARAKLVRRTLDLAPLLPELAGRVRALLDRVAERTAALPAPRAVFLHGSASPSQLLLGEGPPALLDLDAVRRGDPALDVGTFRARLRKCALQGAGGARLRRLADGFLAACLERSPEAADLGERARLVECQELANSAVRSLLSGKPRAAREPASLRLLEDAAACLDRL
jgi:aminoglycoside phosphotransferase (APT) family kinase protein